jgi:glycosyltransferase involved in cell wall biosynthesis
MAIRQAAGIHVPSNAMGHHPSVLFYTESPVLGGHEKMALAAHRALHKYRYNISIRWLVNRANIRLVEELCATFADFRTMQLDNSLRLPHLSFSVIRQISLVARRFREIAPDLIVPLQGGIVGSYGGVLAARLAGIPICSYIAMTQRSTELAPYRFPRLWNALRSIYYKLIPNYITIDDAQALNIRRENRSAVIYTVENYISPPRKKCSSRSEARERLGLPIHAVVIAVIGRIEFAQKAQDWLVRELSSDSFLADKMLLLVGEGPDAQALSDLCDASPQRAKLRLLGWQENMEHVYSSVDLVLIPSRVEGVPLTMLEALSRRIPVVGSDRDGMATWLPAHWRFPFGNLEKMKGAIDCALRVDATDDWETIEGHLGQVTDERRFMQAFGDAIAACIGDFPPPRPL